MIKNALLSFLVLGTILGASAMFNTMYEQPLLDYSIQSIQAYTLPLYSLGNNIFTDLIGNIFIYFSGIIELISIIIDVITQIFTWLSNQLGNLISSLVNFLESFGFDFSDVNNPPPSGCIYINGRLECL
jgi:hypothetical protein